MAKNQYNLLAETFEKQYDKNLVITAYSTANFLEEHDVVPVVRCKDCKHGIWDEENEMWKCVESAEYDEDVGEWFGFYEYHNEDFFCSYGERRTDERKAD